MSKMKQIDIENQELQEEKDPKENRVYLINTLKVSEDVFKEEMVYELYKSGTLDPIVNKAIEDFLSNDSLIIFDNKRMMSYELGNSNMSYNDIKNQIKIERRNVLIDQAIKLRKHGLNNLQIANIIDIRGDYTIEAMEDIFESAFMKKDRPKEVIVYPIKKYSVSYDITIKPLISSGNGKVSWKRVNEIIEATSYAEARKELRSKIDKEFGLSRRIKSISIEELKE